MSSGYSAPTGAAVALVAATAKVILGVQSHANHGLILVGFEVGFDGVTATAVPVLIEVCHCTWATNAPGTASTAVTVVQQYGRAVAVSSTFRAARDWSSAPTVLTPVKEFLLTPNAGLVAYNWLLGKEPDCNVSEGFALRCTAPAGVNVRGTMSVERI